MARQAGFFGTDERLWTLSAAASRSSGWRRWSTSSGSGSGGEGGGKRRSQSGRQAAYDAVLMFRVLLPQPIYAPSDEETEYQLRDHFSFMRFAGLALHEPVPDAKTIWLYREQLTRAGALGRAFERFDAMLRDRDYLARGGQIVDATVIEARRPRLTLDEKQIVRDRGTPGGWSKARTRQIGRDGRRAIKRSRKQTPPEGARCRPVGEIAVPVFGYKNHLGIDRAHGFIRRFVVIHAGRHDRSQLGALLDADNIASDVWVDTAYGSRANLALIPSDAPRRKIFALPLSPGRRVHEQRPRRRGPNIYGLHAPEVECIGKGKVHRPYEFGAKVSAATPLRRCKDGQFVTHVAALPGNRYDGHALAAAIAAMDRRSVRR